MQPESSRLNELIALAQRNLQDNNFADAAHLLDQATALEQDNPDLLQMAGVIHSLAGRHARAVQLLRKVAARLPREPQAHANLARALWRAGQPAEALHCHTRLDALGVRETGFELDRATLLSELNRFDEALASCERACAMAPDHAPAWSARGSALHELRRYADALDCFDCALKLDQGLVSGWANKGLSLYMLQRHEDAFAHQQRALELDPGNARTWSNCAATLMRLRQYEPALACCDKALALWPAEALPEKGRSRLEGEGPQAHRQYVATLFTRGRLLLNLKRISEAMLVYTRLLEIAPDADDALSMALFSFRSACDWRNDAAWHQQLEQFARDGQPVQQPFVAMMVLDDPALLSMIARRFAQSRVEPPKPPSWTSERYRHERLRIAYLSADFRHHPTAYLAAGVFEHHDRSRIELTAVDLGTLPPDPVTERIRASFEHYIEAGSMTNQALAAMLREREIDIAVDLMGHTNDSRPGVFSWRPAPVHVGWLGHPGTTGMTSIDYLLADRIVIPPADQMHYTEKIVYLDGCYQCNDNTREISDAPLSRDAFGLPDHAFVYCCFNQAAKLTPAMFGLWMAILTDVPGSVLWLLGDDPLQVSNLRQAAASFGIDPARLVFTARLPQAKHLARHRLADLALDTLPCNSHTTASDALWAGLPVLTCTGTTFAGRVATSLLHAAGLPELICGTLQSYRQAAVELATSDKAQLHALRNRLQRTRDQMPLFDTAAFTRRLESALFSLAR